MYSQGPLSFELKVRTVPSDVTFKIGGGARRKALFAVLLPIGIHGTNGLISVHVVSGDCPLLLSLPFLKSIRSVIDTDRDQLLVRAHAHNCKLEHNNNEHYMLNLCNFSKKASFAIPLESNNAQSMYVGSSAFETTLENLRFMADEEQGESAGSTLLTVDADRKPASADSDISAAPTRHGSARQPDGGECSGSRRAGPPRAVEHDAPGASSASGVCHRPLIGNLDIDLLASDPRSDSHHSATARQCDERCTVGYRADQLRHEEEEPALHPRLHIRSGLRQVDPGTEGRHSGSEGLPDVLPGPQRRDPPESGTSQRGATDAGTGTSNTTGVHAVSSENANSTAGEVALTPGSRAAAGRHGSAFTATDARDRRRSRNGG